MGTLFYVSSIEYEHGDIFTIDFEDIAKEKFEDLGEFAQIDDWYVKCMLQATIAAWTK